MAYRRLSDVEKRLVNRTPAERKVCIGCGRPAPRSASRRGWWIVELAGGGHGRRFYRNCGCLPGRVFNRDLNALYASDLDLPSRVEEIIEERSAAAKRKEAGDES